MGCAWPRRQPGFPVKHALGYKSGVRAATAGGPVRKGRLDGAAMAGAAEIQGEIDAAGDGAGGRDMDPINPSKRWIDG